MVGQHLQETETEAALVLRMGKCEDFKVRPGLHREWLIEELLVEMLLDIMHQDDGFALAVVLWSSCPAHHLKHIWGGRGGRRV